MSRRCTTCNLSFEPGVQIINPICFQSTPHNLFIDQPPVPAPVPEVQILRDGLPVLSQICSNSLARIPSVEEHGPCAKEVKCFHIIPDEFEMIQFSQNIAWALTSNDNMMSYASVNDIAVMIRLYLHSFVSPMKLPLRIASEMAITYIRSDLFVLTHNSILVGVVVVKKPGDGVLNKPTVTGELFDQMKFIQLFYGTGPVLGILTTGEQFVVCWFPEDDEVFSAPPKEELYVESPSNNAKGKEKKSFSPAADTPSQKRGPSNISTVDEETTKPKKGKSRAAKSAAKAVETVALDRKLSCTKTIDAASEKIYLGQVIATCLTRMSHARSQYYSFPQRHLFRFHRGPLQKFTWMAASCDSSTAILEKIRFDKFPNAGVKNLLAVEDMGRWSNGKVWLTTTETFKSVCVLKFDNENNRCNLDFEAELWIKLYDSAISSMVKVDQWSGAFALMMPYFATIQEIDRELYRLQITKLLERIHNLGYYHDDVYWRNMGCYRDDAGVDVPILLDLIHVKKFALKSPSSNSKEWIQKGLRNLFPSSLPIEPVRAGGENQSLFAQDKEEKEEEFAAHQKGDAELATTLESSEILIDDFIATTFGDKAAVRKATGNASKGPQNSRKHRK
eukprot:gene27628-36433_t